MPSRDDGLFPCFRRRQLSVTPWRGAVLAGLLFLPSSACDDEARVAQDPVAPREDAGGPPSPDDPTDVPGDAGGGLPPLDPEEPAGIGRLPDLASGASPESDVLAIGVLEMLDDSCGECHANADNGAGFSGGLDLARLIETGLIVPGSSAASPLLGRILDGSMPPGTPAGQIGRAEDPTIGDLTLLADFIDQLATDPLPSCEPLPFVSRDAVYAALLADVQSRPADERPNLRYVSLTGASNARFCGPALEQQRQALFKLVNSLSMQSEIHLPVAIDAAALLYRIDLRSYGWDREIDIDADGGVDFGNGWDAALRTLPDRVAFAGPEASALSVETGAPVPLASASAFIRVASDGDVYRALLGVETNVFDMQLSFGLDSQAALENGNVQRAAFGRYARRSEVLVNRYVWGELGERALWSLDIDQNIDDSGSIYSDPLGFFSGPSQTIWELPNGLHGYLVNDPSGAPLTETPRGCVGICVRSGEQHAVACLGCHADGLMPLQDTVRAYVERYETQFDPETFNDTLAVYAPATELEAIVSRDNDRYRAALERAGVQPGTPDPISRVYLDYDRPLDLERAAAELGVSAEVLSGHLGTLPALAPLAEPSGTVERAAFSAAYGAASCTVHATSRNRPVSCP